MRRLQLQALLSLALNNGAVRSIRTNHVVGGSHKTPEQCEVSPVSNSTTAAAAAGGGVVTQPPSSVDSDWIQRLTSDQLSLLASRLGVPAFASTTLPPVDSTGDTAAAAAAKPTIPNSILRSIVKIYAASMEPSSIMPWQLKQQQSVTGSGFVLDLGRRIIATNAHVVQSAHFVEVRKHGDSEHYRGHVVYLAADCDLAFVHISDGKFWEETSLQALPFFSVDPQAVQREGQSVIDVLAARHASYKPFDGLPDLQGSVKVAGYPVGGDQISITSGVVSRIDVSSYGAQASSPILAIQLDAAINSGNSGGPALNQQSQVVGVAFQVLTNADNIGYIIPLPVIAAVCHQFLNDPVGQHLSSLRFTNATTTATATAQSEESETHAAMARSYCPALPTFSFTFQTLLNPHLRKHFGLVARPSSMASASSSTSTDAAATTGGVLIRYVAPMSCVQNIIQPQDVLLHVGSHRIDHDGTVEYRSRERIHFAHLVHMCPSGTTLPLTVLRGGKTVQLEAAPKPHRHLAPPHLFTAEFREWPKCLVLGGLVFSTLTTTLLAEWGREWYNTAPRWLVQTASEFPSSSKQEAVVLVQVIPHAVNKQYDRFYAHMIVEVDGSPVASFEDFTNLLRKRVAAFRAKRSESTSNAEKPSLEDEVVVLTTSTAGPDRGTIVLSLKEALAANEELHTRSGLPNSFPAAE